MKNFEAGKPTEGCMFPKPHRVKRPKSKLKAKPKGKIAIAMKHNDMLNKAMEIAEEADFGIIHVPDSLYDLIGVNGELSWILPKALGDRSAVALKHELSLAFKGIVDLIIFAPLPQFGMSLSLIGDVKIGHDKLNAAQRRFARQTCVKEWRSIDSFRNDFSTFVDFYNKLTKFQPEDLS